jgi:hypothetical protein
LELSLRQSSGPVAWLRTPTVWLLSVFTHSRIQTSERAFLAHQTTSQHHQSSYNIFLACSLRHESTSTASHLTARPSHRPVTSCLSACLTPVYLSRHDNSIILLQLATKVANRDSRKSGTVLPNLAEGGRRIWWWRLEVCCKRLGLLGNRHALRWEAADETQTRLQVLLLVACRAKSPIGSIGLVRCISFLVIEEVCLLI